VALTGDQRRALRVIEEALTEDPRLSVLLGQLAAADRPRRRLRTMTWIYVALSVMVLVFGMLVDEPGARDTDIFMVVMIPAVHLGGAEVVPVGDESDAKPGLRPCSSWSVGWPRRTSCSPTP
jgi:Protein of unknown function (DUF3040)